MAELASITVAGPDDLDDIRLLFREYAAGLGFDLAFQDFERELAQLPWTYAPPGGGLWIARGDDRAPAGCVALRVIGPGTCEMKRLYVRPAYRRNGLGRRLADVSIRHARELGYARMRLDTIDTMHAAIALYRSLGFRITEPYCVNPIDGAVFFQLDLRGPGEESR